MSPPTKFEVSQSIDGGQKAISNWQAYPVRMQIQ